MFDKIKKEIASEHAGFAITLEVFATLVMMTIFLTCTLYMLRVMNTQRFMNTVLTSTASEASRWGGVNTTAYHDANPSSPLLLKTAQDELDTIAPAFNSTITGSPGKITNNGDPITITIIYHLPSVFSTMSDVNGPSGSYNMFTETKDMHMSITVNSVMEAGRLL